MTTAHLIVVRALAFRRRRGVNIIREAADTKGPWGPGYHIKGLPLTGPAKKVRR
jgi:hypothetical protein